MKKKLLVTSAAVAMVVLAGCGGGSSETTTSASSTTTVSGTAVDELILNGIVRVVNPNDENNTLAEGRTSDENGSYRLSIENYKGSIVVNVTCDENSSILVDGSKQPCPNELNLNSVANAEGEEVNVHISPLTEVIYQRAKTLGVEEASNIDKAINEVSALFGVNPVLNDPTQGTYAEIVETLHDVAEENNESIFDVVDAFAEDLNDGTIDNSAALGQALKDANITTIIPDEEGEEVVVPDNPNILSDTAQVKAFVQDLRTQGSTMESYVQNEAEVMGTTLENVALDIQTVTDYVVGIIDTVVKAQEEGASTFSQSIDVTVGGGWESVDVVVSRSQTVNNGWDYHTGSNGEYIGTIIFPQIEDGMEYTFTSLSAKFNGTLPYVEDMYAQTLNVQTQTVSLDISLSKSGDVVSINLSDFTIENSNDSISIDSLTGQLSYSQPDSASQEDGPVFNYVKLDEVTLTAVAGNYTATGTLSVPEYAVNASLAARGGVEEVISTYANFGIYCPSGANIDGNATLTLNGVSYEYEKSQYGNWINFWVDNVQGDYSYEEIQNATTVNATCEDGSNFTVDYYYSYPDYEERVGNSGYIPKKVTFSGSLKNIATNGELSGTINVELKNADTINLVDNDKIDEDLLLKVDVNGKLLMPSRPETLVNIGYETGETDAQKHIVNGSYTHDTTLLTVTGAIDKAGDNGQLTFTNGTGVTAMFNLNGGMLTSGNAVNGTGSLVTKDGAVVATIEERDDNIIIIKYLDGSFESIF